MSWNGYPKRIRNFLIGKLKRKYNTPSSIPPQNSSINDNLPKIWIRIPYLGKQSENLVKSCISKIRRQLTNPAKFVIIYNTEKVLYFTSTKDKIPKLSRNNFVYQITCRGCNKTYIGKTDRCLEKRLSKHSTPHNRSAVAQHLLHCKHAQFLANLHTQYDRHNDLSFSSNLFSSIKNLIFNNYKILYSSNSITTNKLLIIEALNIKFNKPELHSDLKATKELSLFT